MRRSVWIVCVLVVLGWTALASAQEWRPGEAAGAPVVEVPPGAVDLGEALLGLLRAPQLGLELERVELEVERVLPVGTSSTVRLAQRHRGLPVLGKSAAVHLAADGTLVAANLDVARELTVDITPTLTLEEALEVIGGTSLAGGLTLPLNQSARGELAVMADVPQGRLVWDIVVPTLDGGYRYRVDAHDGSLRGAQPMAVHALGRVYPISAVVTPTVADLELPGLDTADPQVLRGWGNRFNVTNYVSGDPNQGQITVEQTVTADDNGDFLFDPPANANDPSDAFAQVSTFYHLSRMRDYFTATHGLDTSGPEWALTAVANLRQSGQPLDNAYYSPQGMTGPFAAPNMIGIGQGTIDFAYDSDVIMHEFTHYITGVAVGYNQGQFFVNEWGLQTAGGSIDEGVSDYFASTVNGDPVVSEMALGALGASRNLATAAQVCPDDVWGEVHADGEIIGAYAWSVREALGAELADKLIWGSVTLLTSSSSLGDVARGAELIADGLVASGEMTVEQRDQLAALAAPRGLDECGQSLPLRSGEPRRTTLIGLDFLGAALGVSCAQIKFFGFKLQSPFHFHAEPPADATAMRLKVSLNMPGGSGALDYEIYGRVDDNVVFQASGFGAEPATFDYFVDDLTAANSELVIDANSNPPFDPTRDYHFVLMQANCPLTWATVEVEYDVPPAPEEDIVTDISEPTEDTAPEDTSPAEDTSPDVMEAGAESTEEKSSSDDCSCTGVRGTSEGSPRPFLFGALGALLGLVTLRRRRRSAR